MAWRHEGYPHLLKSPSYNNGGNWGYGSLGTPPDPLDMMREYSFIQSDTAMGEGAVVETEFPPEKLAH